MIELPLGESEPGKYILVLRINPDTAARPVFVQVTAKVSNEKRNIFVAPVRMPGATRMSLSAREPLMPCARPHPSLRACLPLSQAWFCMADPVWVGRDWWRTACMRHAWRSRYTACHPEDRRFVRI
jgi:hypothetical protein